MDKIIASLGLSNTHGLAIWDINDDEVVVSMVSSDYGTKRTYKLYYTNKGAYFNYKGTRFYIHEFMRTVAV